MIIPPVLMGGRQTLGEIEFFRENASRDGKSVGGQQADAVASSGDPSGGQAWCWSLPFQILFSRGSQIDRRLLERHGRGR